MFARNNSKVTFTPSYDDNKELIMAQYTNAWLISCINILFVLTTTCYVYLGSVISAWHIAELLYYTSFYTVSEQLSFTLRHVPANRVYFRFSNGVQFFSYAIHCRCK